MANMQIKPNMLEIHLKNFLSGTKFNQSLLEWSYFKYECERQANN
jgi:hypothetical protein